MKALFTIVSASALMCAFTIAEAAPMNQKGGQGKTPEKVSYEMGEQSKGKGYGQGQGEMQGEHKGTMKENKERDMMENKEKKMGKKGMGNR